MPWAQAGASKSALAREFEGPRERIGKSNMKIDYSSLPSGTLGICRAKFPPLSLFPALKFSSCKKTQKASPARFLDGNTVGQKETCRLGFLLACDDDNIPGNLLTVVVLARYSVSSFLTSSLALPRQGPDVALTFSILHIWARDWKSFPVSPPIVLRLPHFNPNARHSFSEQDSFVASQRSIRSPSLGGTARRDV